MYSSKLFLWIDALTKGEKNRFREYIQSPFFNKNEDSRKFLEIIYEDTDRQLSKEEVFKLLFPGDKFEQRRLTDQVYYLTRHLENFLALLKFDDSPILQKINLLAESRDRNLEKLVLATSKNIEDALGHVSYRDNNYYYQQYLFQAEMEVYQVGKGHLQREESLQKKTDSLDIFYITAKLRDYCEMLNRQQIIQSTYRMPVMPLIINYIEQYLPDAAQYPEIMVYYQVLKMLQKPEEETFFKQFIDMVSEHSTLFPATELRDMYIYAQNYCIRKINAGDNAYYRDLFDINKQLLETGLILLDGQISQRDYKNITSMALRLGEHAWTLKFIEDYKSRLPAEYRQNVHAYNLANYFYETGEYARSTRLLHDVEFTDVSYNLDAKSMLLKIYYEQEEQEAFFALTAAFKIYLTRNKLISDQNFTNYSNLLKYTKKAFYLKTTPPYRRNKDFEKKVKDLRQKVEVARNVLNSKWLLEQIDALLK